MQRIGRISTTGAGKGAEHATHQGVNLGKVEKFRYAMDQADHDAGMDPQGRGHDGDQPERDEHRDGEAPAFVIVR